MKQFGSTLILLVVVAAIGGYIYFNERGPIADKDSTVLLRTDPNAIASIQLTKAGGHTIVLQKAGESWKVQENKATNPPVPADADTVKTLVDQVQLVQSNTAMPNDPARLKEYGLDKPKGTVTVGTSTIEFGDKPKFDASKVYARVTGGGSPQIALLPASFGDTVNKSFDDWRDKSILRVALDDTKGFDLKTPSVDASFVKVEPTGSDTVATWNIAKPIATAADATTVEGLINQLPTTKTTKFLDEKPASPAKWGLDKPAATLKVATKDGERTLLVGKKLKSGYAAQNSLSPAIFEITDATYGLMNRPLKDWRSKTVLKFDSGDITALDVTARHATRSFTKSGDKWKAAAGAPPTANADNDSQAVLDLIIDLQGLTAENFIDKPVPPATLGFDKPRLELKLTSTKASSPITVQVAQAGGQTYARTGTGAAFGPTVYVLPKTALASFKSPLDTLFPKPKK